MKNSLILLLFLSNFVNAQDRYWVYLTDKKDVTFNPYEYFDPKAIDRRIKTSVSLYDSTDFPLNQAYVHKISELTETVEFESRWFNSVFVSASENQIEEIKRLSFVKDVQSVLFSTYPADYITETTEDIQELLIKQTERMQGSFFSEKNIDGKGVRIAIFDGGFPAVNTSPVFEHIRNENRILKTFDFTKNKEFVYYSIAHGTMVMSCIGGILDGKKMGLATGAEFLLAKTEINSEPFSEEKNWLAAVEWADKNGVDVINSSLGYTYHRYFVKDMDGKTSLVARAANLAARKGILVVNSNGNEADSKWKYLGTPADADSVLSIGGIDPHSDYHISFSSFGPTADKRMKPNVCAFGTAAVAGKNQITKADGTSFSSPLVAGFAACAWQTNRDLTNMELFNEIQKSGDLYPYYDYAHGFGVPQAGYFVNTTMLEKIPTFEIFEDNNLLKIIIPDSLAFISDPPSYLYYHIENNEGYLDKYAVISVYSSNAFELDKSLFNENIKLRFHYRGYTKEVIINNH
ncbi:MAG TPA: peptidase S8 [Bacteroidales bacterium]|nr:MAG: hypothetical protein A2W98_07350 [Bacteroidetes bacterium GWF2_33_38]OFY74172.1 MAG: hypothetical protein A2265_04825 [Bacteroidetes bacterium RIFOXYA12_FULL_33_9]OFY87808.1 MAG: hypothetical protein A2236_01345 [Bacteroidetes bacterium RIFOXYA2_FULL_33_7]HBF88195.1 peptidase S8 [Bacteroidales bacterium]